MTHGRATKGELRFVLASRVIPEGPKLVWLQHWTLDPKGHGCWLTNAQLAERLGMTESTVESHRLRLAEHGLLIRIPPGRTQARGWCAVVPADCRYRGVPDPDTVIRFRETLDCSIGRWRPPDRPTSRRASERPSESLMERRVGSRSERPSEPGDSSAFDSPPLKPSSAFQEHKAEEFSVTAETADEQGSGRELDRKPVQEVVDAGFTSIRTVLDRAAASRRRKVGT